MGWAPSAALSPAPGRVERSLGPQRQLQLEAPLRVVERVAEQLAQAGRGGSGPSAGGRAARSATACRRPCSASQAASVAVMPRARAGRQRRRAARAARARAPARGARSLRSSSAVVWSAASSTPWSGAAPSARQLEHGAGAREAERARRASATGGPSAASWRGPTACCELRAQAGRGRDPAAARRRRRRPCRRSRRPAAAARSARSRASGKANAASVAGSRHCAVRATSSTSSGSAGGSRSSRRASRWRCALQLARRGRLLERVALGRLGRQLVDVGEDRLGQQVERLRLQPGRDAAGREAPPGDARADAVGGEQHVEAAARRAPRRGRGRRRRASAASAAPASIPSTNWRSASSTPTTQAAAERPLERARVGRHLDADRVDDLAREVGQLRAHRGDRGGRQSPPRARVERRCGSPFL